MKKIILLTSLLIQSFLFAPNSFSQTSLEDFSAQVRRKNFTVLEQAQKVYQAKENIEAARGELMPSLNVWNIIKIASNPLDLTSWAEMAPFLSPANWFRLEQNKIYFQAESYGYRALVGNQVLNARVLFIKVNQDQKIYKMIKDYKSDLQGVYDIAKIKVDLGMETPEYAREIQIRILALQEDLIRMKVYLADVRRELSFVTGGAGDIELTPKDVPALDMKSKNKLPYETVINDILARSNELKQYDELLKIIPQIKKEITFSFLGLTPASMGTGGGFFDNIPIPSGLGFGTGPSMNIAKSQEQVLRIQRQSVFETLRKQTKSATDQMGAEIDVRPVISERKQLATENSKQLLERLKLGENINLIFLADTLHAKRIADAAMTENEIQFRLQREKVDRLLVVGDYFLQ